jgi:hypothetical protein
MSDEQGQEQDSAPEPRVSVPLPRVSELRASGRPPQDAVPDSPGSPDDADKPRSTPRFPAGASIVTGLAAIALAIDTQYATFLLSPVSAIAAIVFGAVSRKRSRRLWGYGSDAGALGIALGVIALIWFFVLFFIGLRELGASIEDQGLTRLAAARA